MTRIDKPTAPTPVRPSAGRNQPPPSTTNKAEKADQETIEQRVLSQLSTILRPDTPSSEARRKVIVATLTEAFGEKASLEPAFNKLIDKIDSALADSKECQAQLAQLLSKLK